MSFYIDTSVLVAFYVPEVLSPVAEDILRSEAGPAISDLTEVEMNSALARKVRQGELSRENAAKVRALFSGHLQAGLYRRLALDRHHFRLARDWISQWDLSLRSLDGLHLAVASLEDLELVTADKGLAASAESLGLPCRMVLASLTNPTSS